MYEGTLKVDSYDDFIVFLIPDNYNYLKWCVVFYYYNINGVLGD